MPTCLLFPRGYDVYMGVTSTWVLYIHSYYAYMPTMPAWLLCLHAYCAYVCAQGIPVGARRVHLHLHWTLLLMCPMRDRIGSFLFVCSYEIRLLLFFM